ncbi:penicillin acylase family protein [Plantactinospora sp. GCM10030261]|uniref:penicillin acylase family protein n=1 Tax=Plantactinospora sp. GCM10030261 TaxID=3273420 RepID=UPI00361835EA
MRWVNAVLAAAVSALLLLVLAVGAGTVPALGPALNPGAGVWGSAADARPVQSRTVQITGMTAPVTVDFDAIGTPAVRAGSDDDLFAAQGYLHASFRLTQLDLERRMAHGRLAELVGPAGVESDTFELQSGLLRTARSQWAATAPDSPAARALTAYSRGVNARLAEVRESGEWPAVFALTGVYPEDWTPVDSLAVQGLLSQNLSYSTRSLDYALLQEAFGTARTMQFFPVNPPNEQRPYDPGPYRNLGVDPLPAGGNANAATPALAPAGPPPAPNPRSTALTATAAADILATVDRLPQPRVHTYPMSNAWAANGPVVEGGAAMLAGDPHLQLTLPSFWYQMALAAPGTDVAGATLIGLPGVVIGRNRNIAWSITDVQNQSTVFYVEKTSPDRPGEYFWKGAWRQMESTWHSINVRGAAPVRLEVQRTVHGPVMTQKGMTTSVAWMGNYHSSSVDAILAVNKAADYGQFRAALAQWHSPTVNFAYADDRGDIAVLAAGYFPVIQADQPWFPLSGTGEQDIVGVIPYGATPEVHNPPGHVVATANQRPVGANYPYYLGTSLAAYDSGYRARRIYHALEGRRGLTTEDFRALQNDLTDELASLIRPKLRDALTASASPAERAALDVLTGWDVRMTGASAGATIWWTFWDTYLREVFDPWWTGVKDVSSLKVTTARAGLNQNLEHWTLRDPGNAVFTPPGAARRDAAGAMRDAFRKTVQQLTVELGADPAAWRWDRVHTVEIPSLLEAGPLGYGPSPAGGHRWTVNSAEGERSSSFGPSYRLIVDWTGPSSAQAWSIYPGGQSENPVSEWYRNLLPDWEQGRLRDFPLAGNRSTGARWTLRPEGAS